MLKRIDTAVFLNGKVHVNGTINQSVVRFRRIQCRIIIAGMQRKRRIEHLSLGNGKAVELKLIKHDKAFKELKEF